MNSKELAVTFPVVLLAWEWVWRRPPLAWRWLVGQGRIVTATAVLTIMFVAGRSMGPDSLMTMEAYRPVFTAARFLETSANFVGGLLFRTRPVHAATAVALFAVLGIIAWKTGSRTLRFAWLFIMIAPIPVAFITPRGPSQYFVAYFGWVLFAGAGLVRCSRFVLRLDALRRPALFAGVAIAMLVLNLPRGQATVYSVAVEAEMLRGFHGQIRRLQPALLRGARILFLDDPIEDQYRLLFLMQLAYGDRALHIDRPRWMPEPPDAAAIASYDYVFDYRDGLLSALPRPPGAEASIVFAPQGPEVFHTDWRRVSPRDPARRGETVIAMAANLGATDPRVPAGEPFPAEPLANVAARVKVRLDGEPAEVLLGIGWPRQVNRFRVDFRVPPTVRPGSADVVLVCRGITGPAVRIAVE